MSKPVTAPSDESTGELKEEILPDTLTDVTDMPQTDSVNPVCLSDSSALINHIGAVPVAEEGNNATKDSSNQCLVGLAPIKCALL